MVELILLRIGSKEWDYVWSYLAKHPINEGIENPTSALNDGHQWEYCGTFMNGERALHQLRHKNHPKCQCVKTISLEASKDFNTEIDIEKKFKL
jgi:hypothetical protein